MIGKPLGKEEADAALVLALSGAVMVLAANGPRPLSLGRIVSGALSNPVPVVGGATSSHRSSSVSAPRRRQVAARGAAPGQIRGRLQTAGKEKGGGLNG